jgi:PhzF family phenazine biosynthesis protein
MPLPSDATVLVQVDAFTNEPFRGNPAAVCLLERRRDDAWLQAVAREMNLSETAFLLRAGDAFSLRWFTPTVEMPLCGHATLASAHALWELGESAADSSLRFATKSGVLTARRDGGWIAMDFPARPADGGPLEDAVLDALGVEPLCHRRGATCHLVEVGSEQAVRAVTPDFRRLARATAVGVTVTSRAGSSDYDFVSRFFAPAAGIDEDPVTGSAHCALGPYWAAKLGKAEVTGYQASQRGGVVRVRVAGADVQPGRVVLLGEAVTVLRATLLR